MIQKHQIVFFWLNSILTWYVKIDLLPKICLSTICTDSKINNVWNGLEFKLFLHFNFKEQHIRTHLPPSTKRLMNDHLLLLHVYVLCLQWVYNSYNNTNHDYHIINKTKILVICYFVKCDHCVVLSNSLSLSANPGTFFSISVVPFPSLFLCVCSSDYRNLMQEVNV